MLLTIIKILILLIMIMLMIPIACIFLYNMYQIFTETINSLKEDKGNILSWYLLILAILLTVVLILVCIELL